jgi:mannosyltransferase
VKVVADGHKCDTLILSPGGPDLAVLAYSLATEGKKRGLFFRNQRKLACGPRNSTWHPQSAAKRATVNWQGDFGLDARQRLRDRADTVNKSLLDNPRVSAILLAVIVVAGVGIRAYRLTDRSMWFDEASSWRESQLALPELVVTVGNDNHVPLYFILLKLWIMGLGDSIWAMRGLSVLLGGMTMVGVYLFSAEAFRDKTPTSVKGIGPFCSEDSARLGPSPAASASGVSSRSTSRWIGLFSAALVAVSLLQIREAVEIRMYTLGTALVALSSWTLFRAMRASMPSWKPWALHALVTLLLAYTHPYGLFSIAGQVVFLIGYFLRQWRRSLDRVWAKRQFRLAILTYSVVAVCWGFWLPVLFQQTRQVQERWWAGSLGSWDVLNRCYEMFLDGLPNHTSAVIAALVCAGVLIALVWRAGAGQWYVLCLAVVPYTLGVGASFALGANVLLLRYLVFAQLFLLVALAALVGRIYNRWVRNAVAALLVFNCADIHVDSWLKQVVPRDPGPKAAIAFIEANRHPNEEVIVASPLMYFPATYYFKDRAKCHLFSNGTPFLHFAGGAFAISDDLILADQIDKLGPGRVWVVHGGWWAQGPIPIPARWLLEQREPPQGDSEFEGGLVVEVYDIPAQRHLQ